MSVWGNPVLIGGGSGGGSILRGTAAPSASLGSDGDIYIQTVPWSAEGMVDSGLGWAVREDCYAEAANTFYGTLSGRTYYKSYDGPCIVCYGLHSGGISGESSPYTFPITISTNWEYARRTDSYTNQPSSNGAKKTVSYMGMTWYFDISYGMGVSNTISDGQIGSQQMKRIGLPASVSTWEDAAKYILSRIGICAPNPKTVCYKKSSGTWAKISIDLRAYLESSGTQYIDTGLIADSDTDLYVKYWSFSESGSYILGARTAINNKNYDIMSQASLLVDFGATRIQQSDFAKGMHSIDIRQGQVYVDGVFVQTISETFVTEYNQLLFAFNNGGTPLVSSKSRIYRVTYSKNGSPILDLLPAVDPAGAACMYDTVSGQYFYNDGTGDFIVPS